MSVFRRGGKDKDKDKKPRRNFTSPDPAAAIVTTPSGKGDFQRLTSLNVPDPIPDEPESSPCSHHSVSDASALTRTSGRLVESEHEMELEEGTDGKTDGATRGASGGDNEKEKKKRSTKKHRLLLPQPPKLKEIDKKRPGSTFSGGDFQHVPEDAPCVERANDWPSGTILREQEAKIEWLQTEIQRMKQTLEASVKRREGQQAEIEWLQTELQMLADEKETLEKKKNGEVKDVKERYRALINGKAGEIRRKDDKIKRQDDEIKRLQGEIKSLKTVKESDEATRQKLRDVMQKEKTTQHELARVTKDLQAASQREEGLQHDLSHLQGLHREAIERLNRDHQTQLQQLEKS